MTTAAIASLRRSLQLDSDHAEARIYLANILYDQGEYEAALYHFERTKPEDHWDELGIWRLIELKRSLYRLERERSRAQAVGRASVRARRRPRRRRHDAHGARRARRGYCTGGAEAARGQLELFGTLLSSLAEQQAERPEHQIIASDGSRVRRVVGGDRASHARRNRQSDRHRAESS